MSTNHRVNPYSVGLDKNPANYVPLSPLSFLTWAADVYPRRPAVIHGDQCTTWAEVYARCRRLASALSQRGVGVGDTVAVMAPNVPAMFEAHYGIPMAGAVINTLNTRLDPEAIAFMLGHGEAKVLITDTEFAPTVSRALRRLTTPPLVIDIVDPLGPGGERLGEMDYEAFLGGGDPGFSWRLPDDEWDAIALSYTSGTTGNPKGVVTHHRGAYLNALSNIVTWAMPHFPVYLWTLPMFHCNGWCFPWSLAAVAGVSVCLRKVDAALIFDLIRRHQVTHFCGAPVVHNMLINAPAALRAGISHRLHAMIAGAAPPQAVIEGAERIGVELTHVYGLTEVYGPASVCAKHPEWAQLPLEQRAALNGRQGVRYVLQEAMEVLDPETLQPVPRDGQTMGEIFFRGNITMKGYLNNPQATQEAFAGGWFHTGDLAVVDPDGYVKIKDRSKDIIISGGENISTIEVEDVIYRHPAVLEAAVVARPDEKWGEVPCAFVTLKPDAPRVSEQDIIAFCRERLAHYKCPKKVVFGSLPKTSTGKIQKNLLRERAKTA
ncbi:MAG TPA: acyl-CoA synthetase [Burkholderiales bacterium]|jgi:fatty-acyl-CoA synthase|nr:acyl-CoA synthetase [Burkholderiales bacterium]